MAERHRPDVKIPIDIATTPRSGACLADRWWVVVDESVILWRGISPQCNHDRRIAEHVGNLIHPGSEVRHISAVFLGPQNEDGYYTNPLPNSKPASIGK